MNEIKIVFDGDESYEIIAGDESINVNHDEHGWAGIEAALRTARMISKQFNIKWTEE